ncbi:MAG: hypothetical protein DCC55_20630 [Chloroflexi bacterium]|nr:MAG: hypothetical protein DCC55_20630 [Chloroflexota bacterium]
MDNKLHAQATKPLALVVFLENVGHIHGIPLARWMMALIDWCTEEYAKLLLRIHGAYRRYDRVVILEDERATGPELVQALIETSRTHRVDVLLLVHGHRECLVGYKNRALVGLETFGPLLKAYQQNSSLLDLRMVYGLNCYGVTLAPVWLGLGAQVVNGAVGVNWFPEPSLSVFLYQWLRGRPYSQAVVASNRWANRVWRRILRPWTKAAEHPWLLSSRQTVSGHDDITIDS